VSKLDEHAARDEDQRADLFVNLEHIRGLLDEALMDTLFITNSRQIVEPLKRARELMTEARLAILRRETDA